MKLLYVTDNGFSKKNNIEYYSAPNVSHIGNLSKFFDSFTVVARDDNYYPGYTKVPNNIKVILVNKFNIKKLKKTIKNEIISCDAVICYGTNGYYASKIGKKMNKVVISYNGGDPYDFCRSRGTLAGKILAPIAKYMCRQSFKNSDFGHYCDDFLFEKYPASGKMLACSGVDIECNDSVYKKRLKKIKNKNNNKYTIGLTGHLHNSLKGIDIAIKALSLLDDNYCLEIAGRGDSTKYKELSRSLGCQNRIKFLGVLKNGDELMNWLDRLDIYIQPSRIEGLPRATIEAMSRGCPIASSRAGALLKLIDKKYTFDQNDKKGYKTLAKLIQKLSNDKEMINQSTINYNKSKKYERKQRDKKYDDFYKTVIAEIQKRKNQQI